MQANLSKALGWIFISEGGFAVRETEPGGAVNMGVSMQTFAKWRYPQAVTIADLKQLTVAEATQIYNSMYASHINFAQLPSGLDYCVLDAAVNEGVAASIIFLSLGLQSPPVTVSNQVMAAAVASTNLTSLKAELMPLIPAANLTTVINSICDNRLTAKRQRAQWPQFGLGWTNRVEFVRKNSLGML
jgi:lysozyme family protein